MCCLQESNNRRTNVCMEKSSQSRPHPPFPPVQMAAHAYNNTRIHKQHTYICTYVPDAHICVHTPYIRACIHTCTLVAHRRGDSVHSCTHIHACMCLHDCTNVCMHTCTHACIKMCIHAQVHKCMHAYVHTYMHTCMHTYIHMFTHARINMYACVQEQSRRRGRRRQKEGLWRRGDAKAYTRLR